MMILYPSERELLRDLAIVFGVLLILMMGAKLTWHWFDADVIDEVVVIGPDNLHKIEPPSGLKW